MRRRHASGVLRSGRHLSARVRRLVLLPRHPLTIVLVAHVWRKRHFRLRRHMRDMRAARALFAITVLGAVVVAETRAAVSSGASIVSLARSTDELHAVLCRRVLRREQQS